MKNSKEATRLKPYMVNVSHLCQMEKFVAVAGQRQTNNSHFFRWINVDYLFNVEKQNKIIISHRLNTIY
jgi:hypothetical protein